MHNNIPDFLYTLLLEQYGEELTNFIIDGYTKKRPLTLRANTLKTTISQKQKMLKLAVQIKKQARLKHMTI